MLFSENQPILKMFNYIEKLFYATEWDFNKLGVDFYLQSESHIQLFILGQETS